MTLSFSGNRLAFHRNAMARIAEVSEPDPGMAIVVIYPDDKQLSLTYICQK